ncbi:MAG: UMP kinase [Desulfurella sp.]|uniref:Uridylate kinase n=1 Tax=Desulfurella multipotens TaxID=79269 RepID=A0A1G6K1H4_9BACT|nr:MULTISPECIES: UMP kinase [Desulfurella]AHF97125.1 uridylate kinase [Desulfurella acetivorans A63]HEX13258.1 UMP kinase [Desulfurella acetivorans]PMP67596.1 MAG: UMP kinase [Desulfurella multipotens]PMP88151.1 MAG: UMP kinase [Desulfurella sp.]SDC24797.1 uridylate kinase [Desulfurella multipotens]
MAKPAYNNILLKLSGEALLGELPFGIDDKMIKKISFEVKQVWEMGVSISIVIGGGNIFRGIKGAALGMDRASADYMGMLATVINGLALQDSLEKLDVPTRVISAIEMRQISEPYIRRRALRHLEKGRVVIFVAGTGNPYFTTDTAAALRAMEMGAQVLLKATKVDGVYDKDPMVYENAKLIEEITYIQVLDQNLKVMDSTAISMCMEYKLPIIVLNINKEGILKSIIEGKKVGTLVS